MVRPKRLKHIESPFRTLSGIAPVAILALGLSLALGGCKKRGVEYVPPPPPEVTTAPPSEREIPVTLEFTGSTRGIETVEIRARVKGFLQKKHVEGGRRVKTGDLLFSIDPRTFEAELAQAKAEAAAQIAGLKLAEITLGRTQEAMRSGALSQQELDRSQAERDAAKAQVDLALARVRSAELNLEFTQIKSPANGRIGIVTIDEGQLVGATEPTLLTTVINDEQILATHDMDERQLLDLRAKHQNRRPGEDGRPLVEVRLGLANEQGFPHIGQYNKSDNRVNPETGTIRIESIFANPTGVIIPGSFVRLQGIFGSKVALLVPDTAVLRDATSRYILVLGPDDVVERINVIAGPVFERMRPVEEIIGDPLPGGTLPAAKLTTSTRVIVNGLQRVRPGTKAIGKPAPQTPDSKQTK